jgi:hypothetical protein
MFGEEEGVLPIATVTNNWIADSHGTYTIYSGYACSGFDSDFCVSGPRITVMNNHIGPGVYGIWHIANGSLITHGCNEALASDTAIDDC